MYIIINHYSTSIAKFIVQRHCRRGSKEKDSWAMMQLFMCKVGLITTKLSNIARPADNYY